VTDHSVCGFRAPVAAFVVVLVLALAPFVSATNASAATVPVFTGSVEEFYVVPSPLPPGAPGTLIRVQPVSQTATSTTVRIMYHSRDGLLRDRAVTGMLTYPNATPPPGGWPVVSWANGTVGMASQCALSRAGRPVSTMGLAAVGVQSDYVGLGPVGERHPYLSRPSEGFSVIDAVRAARNLTASGAGSRWMAIGVSQGGHGAISANELGEQYAPELELLGTVAGAPAAMFDRTYGGIDAFVTRVVGAMSLYGVATEHPDLDPDDYVTPAAAAASSVLDTGCLSEITAAFLAIPLDEFYRHDPAVTEPARSIAMANDVGWFRVDAPLLLVQGTADAIVVPQRTRDLFARLCAQGQVTRFVEVAGAGHNDVLARAGSDVVTWMSDRLAGRTAATSCPTPPIPTLTPAAGGANEGDHGTTHIEVPVRLSAPARGIVTVPWRTLDVPGLLVPQAQLGVDYDAQQGVLQIPSGSASGSIRLSVRGDTTPEPDELIVVSFGRPQNAVLGGYLGLGFGVITDDD
jgi:pimeloyl-ACP methyl ester carboxylesterase